MTKPVLYDQKHHVACLTLNRPETFNAADTAMLQALIAALTQAQDDPEVRVVVLTGAGQGFCSGADLRAGFEGTFKHHLETTFNPVVRLMRLMPKPVITAVNGVAAGAGASLALAGDIRLWSETASFTEAFGRIALVPDAGSTWLLPRLVGYHRAMQLCLSAERVGAAQGLALGLCEQVLPSAGFGQAVQAHAQQLAEGPAHAFALTKQALWQAMGNTFEAQLQLEGDLQNQAGAHPDFKEGLAAFLEKRPARFNQ